MKTFLITGGAGFLGSNLAIHLTKTQKDAKIIAFDNLIRSGSELNVQRLKENGVEFIKGDVRDKAGLLTLPKIDVLIECSAEPSVLAGHHDPQYMIDTNLTGAINCLELAKRDQADFIFISTSRVYPIDALNALPFEETETRYQWLKDFKGVNEQFPLNGVRSLYGSSKLAAEHIVFEYMDMFGLRAVVNRCGVIAGPWQMGKIDQGIVGFWLAGHYFGGPLKYIGYGGGGKQVRDAVHVDDVCALVDMELDSWDACNGKIFNAGGGRKISFSLMELTGLACQLTGRSIDIGSEPDERKSDIRIYVTDNTLIRETLGWSPQKGLDVILQDTLAWMREHETTLRPVLGV